MPKLRTERGQESRNELSIGVTVYRNEKEESKFNMYRIYIGPKYALNNRDMYPKVRKNTDSLIALKRIPNVWEPDLETAKTVVVNVGYIVYYIPRADPLNTAFTHKYYPRLLIEPGRARKIPYFMESITTKHLKLEGIRYISTTENPDPKRKGQLQDVELPIKERVGIDGWLAGLGKGIRDHIENPELLRPNVPWHATDFSRLQKNFLKMIRVVD